MDFFHHCTIHVAFICHENDGYSIECKQWLKYETNAGTEEGYKEVAKK